MFKITYTPTGIKVTSTETGSSVSVKHTAEGFERTNVMGDEANWFESTKEIANAGYLGRFLKNFTGRLGKKNTPVADKIKTMVEALKLYANCTTYRTLNNKLRQHFDTNEIMTHDAFRAEFFYEGAWRTGGQPKAAKAIVAAPAAKPAKKIKAATTPAVQKAKPAATPAAVKASKPATVKPTASKPKKATVKKVTPAATPVADATPAPVDQDALAAEAEALIAADAPELIEVDADLAEA